MLHRADSPVAVSAIAPISLPARAFHPESDDPYADLRVPQRVEREVSAWQPLYRAEPSLGVSSFLQVSLPDLSTLLPMTKAVWLGVMLTLSTIGTWRAFGMVLKGFRKFVDDVKAFYLGQDLNHAPINLHTVETKGDRLQLNICTVDNETLSGILDNLSAVRLVKKAAKLCTPTQPLLSREFANVSHPVEKFIIRGVQPSSDRLLQEFNKKVVDHYSTVDSSGHMAKGLGEATIEDVQYLVPICEVGKRKECWLWYLKKTITERNLVFAAVPSSLFEKFGDEQFVAKLRHDNPRLAARIDQLEKAWKARVEYANGQGKENGEDFFPDVRVSKVFGSAQEARISQKG